MPASLDHTIWFHRPFRADEWWLYDQFSPFAGGGRGLALARVFSQSGELVATVAQEGLIRLRDGRAWRDVGVGPRSQPHGAQAGDVRPSRCGEPSFGLVSAKVQPVVVLARREGDGAGQEHRPLEGHLDRDRVRQPVLDRRDRTRQGPHAVGDLAPEAERPRGQRVEVDRVGVAGDRGVGPPEVGGQPPLDAAGRRVRDDQARGRRPPSTGGRGAGRSRSTPRRSRRPADTVVTKSSSAPLACGRGAPTAVVTSSTSPTPIARCAVMVFSRCTVPIAG